jgi:hypothetical protein
MITKVLFAAMVAASTGLIAAAPSMADPASFGDLSCTCQDPDPAMQAKFPFAPPAADPIEQGIRQGFADTRPGTLPDGVPHS